MKLQMNDDGGTIITSTDGMKIGYGGKYDDELGHIYHIYDENDKTLLSYSDKHKANYCRKDFDKLLKKGARTIRRPRIDEQEQGWA